VTHNLSEGKTHEPRPYLRGSVRRASGFVLTGKSEVILKLLLMGSPPGQQPFPALPALAQLIPRLETADGEWRDGAQT
jgi:hypothetical protein